MSANSPQLDSLYNASTETDDHDFPRRKPHRLPTNLPGELPMTPGDMTPRYYAEESPIEEEQEKKTGGFFSWFGPFFTKKNQDTEEFDVTSQPMGQMNLKFDRDQGFSVEMSDSSNLELPPKVYKGGKGGNGGKGGKEMSTGMMVLIFALVILALAALVGGLIWFLKKKRVAGFEEDPEKVADAKEAFESVAAAPLPTKF